jgi:hypothetical protein
MVLDVLVAVGDHRAAPVPPPTADDVNRRSEKRIRVPDDSPDVEVMLPVLDRDMERMPAPVEVGNDRRLRPVAIAVDHIATVTRAQQLGVQPRVVRPWERMRTDAYRVHGNGVVERRHVTSLPHALYDAPVPPRKRSSPTLAPLTDDDVADLRSKVGAGEKPRVVVRAASAAVPSGTRGNVIRLGDPREGEFVVVRLGRDEVPFAPAELALPGRAGKAAATTATQARTSAAKSTARAGRGARTTTAAKAAPATPAARGSGTRAAAAKSPAKSSGRSAKPSTVATGRRTGRSSRRSAPALSVTLRFTDGAWTVEAQRGARRLSRPTPLRPGAVKAFADHVDQPEVRDALTETVESCRAVVAERADKLRAELAAAEASLKEYEARRR